MSLQLVEPDPDALTAPAHDADAEDAVIGAVLVSAKVLPDILDTGLTGRDFYQPRNETIWGAVTALAGRRQPVDAIALAAELTRSGDLAKVGGHAQIHTLMAGVPSAASGSFYAARVRDLATLRRLAAAGTKVHQLGSTVDVEGLDAAIDAAQAEVAAVADTRHAGTGDDDLDAAIDETIDDLQHGTAPALATGLGDLDRLLNGGLRPGTVTTLGARPGVGKTVIGLQVALHVATHEGVAGYTSLEMHRRDLLVRGYAALAALDYSRLQKSPGEPLSESEWRAVSKAAERVRSSGLVIPDRSYASVASIRADIRRVTRRRGSCALWVIDYLQLVTPADRRVIREQQVAGIMRGLKLAALELGTPLLVLAQLSREGEKSGRPPVLTDLRESGSVEQDSDNVILLHRQTQGDSDGPGPDELGVIVAKNRRGATGGFGMTFEGHHQRAVPKRWRPSDAVRRGAS
jgi:replicative DNA helicase